MSDSTKSRRRFQFGMRDLSVSVALAAAALASAIWFGRIWNVDDGKLHEIAGAFAYLCLTSCAFAAIGALFCSGLEAAYVGAFFGAMTIGPFMLVWTVMNLF